MFLCSCNCQLCIWGKLLITVVQVSNWFITHRRPKRGWSFGALVEKFESWPSTFHLDAKDYLPPVKNCFKFDNDNDDFEQPVRIQALRPIPQSLPLPPPRLVDMLPHALCTLLLYQ